METTGFTIDREKAIKRWKPICGSPELNEEKYINERRKKILEDIFNDESEDIDDIKETDFKELDKIKKDFMEGGGLLFFDYNYGKKEDDEK